VNAAWHRALTRLAYRDCTCGVRHDRDVTSAQIILAAGRAERLNACGGDVRLGHAEQSPAKQEVAA